MIDFIVKKLYSFKCYRSEKKMLSNVRNKLTKNEKKKISKCNINVATIMKNVYKDWDSCNYEYFVSDPYFQMKLLPKLNDVNYGKFGIRHKWSYFSDKNYQDKFATSFLFPNIVIRCINGEFFDNSFNYVDYDHALEVMNNYSSLVFKISLGLGHGKGVKLVTKDNYVDAIKDYGKNFVVQEVIKQNAKLSYFNSSSVNIIRITSLNIKGEVYILGSVLRVGAPGSFCDHLNYGNERPRIIGIKSDGKLSDYSLDPDNCVVYDDIFGKKIDGFIPKFDEMISLVKENHKYFAHHRIIGWDITLDEKENIICVEFNSIVPGIVQTQMVCGPIFEKKSKNGISLLEEIKKM